MTIWNFMEHLNEKNYDFSEKLFTEKIQVFYSKTVPVAFSRLDDLKGKKVGVIRGWSYGGDFDNARKAGAVIAEDGDSDEGNVRKLDAGHLDVVIAVAECGAAIMAKDKNIGVVVTPLTQNATYIAFSKTANMKALLQQFDQALKEMQKTGELKSAVSAALGK